uniref:Galectin n=1 Tax=Meloidogyne incognita TaxID=6306 RepID=A0A914MIX7_MELIC
MTGTFLNGGSCIKLADPGAIALTANVPVHFANDPTKKLQRFNSWIKGKGWTPEDRTGGYPFKANNQFVMEWSAENRTTIRVIVDGKFWKLFSREDLSNIEQLDFSYFIRISSVKLCRQEIETTTPEIPTTTPSPPTCPNEVLITNVSIGNVNLLNYGFGIGFTEGKSIIMTGTLLNGGSCIKLGDPGVLLQTADAVFHFSPNNVAKHVICNSWMKGKGWTPEDKSGGYPFNPNNQFELQWIAEPNNIVKIYVDRKFFRTFSREDLSKVVQIDFSYAIRISSIKLCREEIETTTPEIPTTTPPPPTCPNEVLITNVSIGNINLIKYGFGKGFTVGKSIIITGTFLNGGSCIKLADAGVITVTGNVPFHFATDPTKKLTICNSWMKGKGWTPEDRSGVYPFNPNNQFFMEWVAEPNNTIRLNVDGKFWKTFSREDLSNIEQLDFSYFIRISSVKLCRQDIETTTPTIPTPPPKCPNEVLITNVVRGD